MMSSRLLLLSLLCVAADLPAKAQDHFPAWLSGTWQVGPAAKSRFENWRQEGASLMRGRSFRVNGKDTIILETVVLKQEYAKLWYIPTVAGQNNGLPVPFESDTITERRLVFVNPGHDFPQQITYTRIGDDSLLAEVSGTLSGQPRRIQFPMKRVR